MTRYEQVVNSHKWIKSKLSGKVCLWDLFRHIEAEPSKKGIKVSLKLNHTLYFALSVIVNEVFPLTHDIMHLDDGDHIGLYDNLHRTLDQSFELTSTSKVADTLWIEVDFKKDREFYFDAWYDKPLGKPKRIPKEVTLVIPEIKKMIDDLLMITEKHYLNPILEIM